jgi:hypothetical protein
MANISSYLKTSEVGGNKYSNFSSVGIEHSSGAKPHKDYWN